MKTTVSTLATILVLAVGGSTAQAAVNLYWDANGAGSGTGGTGPWNASALTWRVGNHVGTLQAWVNGNNATFVNGVVYYVTPATITLETDITVGSLNFQNDHYTINGPFTLTSDAAVSGVGTTVTGGSRASGTINVPVIMKGGDISYRNNVTFNKSISDDGGNRQLQHYFDTLTLNASNSFTRGVWLRDATADLVIGHDHALGSGMLTVVSGLDLEAGGGDRTVTNAFSMDYNGLLTLRGTNNLTFTAPLILRANGGYPRFSVAETNTVLTFGSNLLQQDFIDGGLIKEGPGTFVINGTYRADWHTVITNGTLLMNGTTVAPLNNYSYRVWSGATLGGTGVVNLAASGSTCTVYRAGALSPGTHRTGSRVGTLRVNGPVSLAEHAIFKWDCQDGAGDLLNVNGRLSLPAMVTVVVSRISGELPESATIMTANSLAGPGAGDVSGWVVQGERGVRLTVAENTVVIERFQPGTLFMVR
jgi:hypothetical protein